MKSIELSIKNPTSIEKKQKNAVQWEGENNADLRGQKWEEGFCLKFGIEKEKLLLKIKGPIEMRHFIFPAVTAIQ